MRIIFYCLLSCAVLTSFSANSQPVVQPHVVVTFPALYSLAAMAMEGVGKPELLLTTKQDAHHMQLRPSQMKAVIEADLFLYYDANFEVFVPKLRAAATHHTKFLALSAVLGEEHQSPADHGWLNPDFAIAMLHFLAVELGRIDPKNAKTYAQNADSYASAIEEKATGWRNLLQNLDSTSLIVTDHQAFDAFTRYFGISPVLALEDAQGEISLRNLKKLPEKKTSCVWVTHGNTPLMEKIAQNIHAPLNLKLNPLGSLYEPSETLYFDLMDNLDEPSETLYFDLMDNLVQEFEKCLTHP